MPLRLLLLLLGRPAALVGVLNLVVVVTTLYLNKKGHDLCNVEIKFDTLNIRKVGSYTDRKRSALQ